MSRFVFRPLGFRLTWLAARAGLTSEAVSWLSGVVGLAGCLVLVAGSPALVPAGLALLWLFNLLDCVDGSLARALATANPYGRFLDAMCGGVVDLGFWAVVAVLAYRQPELLRWPDPLGYGPVVWLAAGGAACFLAVALIHLERTYDELLAPSWAELSGGAVSAHAAGLGEEAGGGASGLAREIVRNLRVRETHYLLLVVAWLGRAVDVLLLGYLVFYALYGGLLFALYARRGQLVQAAARSRRMAAR
jgi:phosphatidylglycerophosphate synthase